MIWYFFVLLSIGLVILNPFCFQKNRAANRWSGEIPKYLFTAFISQTFAISLYGRIYTNGEHLLLTYDCIITSKISEANTYLLLSCIITHKKGARTLLQVLAPLTALLQVNFWLCLIFGLYWNASAHPWLSVLYQQVSEAAYCQHSSVYWSIHAYQCPPFSLIWAINVSIIFRCDILFDLFVCRASRYQLLVIILWFIWYWNLLCILMG